MKQKKIVYVISDVEKALAFEWVAAYLSQRYPVLFILIGKQATPLSAYLESIRVRVEMISDNEYPSTIRKWKRIFFILKTEKPDIVHTHLWRATLLGMPAAWILRIRKRIFTRHHAMVHHREFPSGLKWDKLCIAMATDIVAISQNVKDIMVNLENAKAAKIHIIHHGFDVSYFDSVNNDSIIGVMKRNGIVKTNSPVIGVISRYLEWKGIQYIIPAFVRIQKYFPGALLVLANTHGDYKEEIKKHLAQLPNDSYIEISFEKDLTSLYKVFDVFVHTPVDPNAEAFGQTYVEALLSGVPSVFTLSGVAPEFVKDGDNALVVPFRDFEAIEKGIIKILGDRQLRINLIQNGKKCASLFSLEGMLVKLEALYA